MLMEAVYKNYTRVDEVCTFLSHYFTDGNLKRWRNLFNLPWSSTEPCGYVMYNDNNEIVGFIGTVFSVRNIDGREVVTCSLSSWSMDKSTRGQGLHLIRKFIKRKEVLFLDLTANEPSRKIFNAFKFKSLESFEYLFPLFFSFNNFNTIDLNEDIDLNTLSKKDQRIFLDHKKSCMQFVKFTYKNTYILMGFTTVKRKKLSFLEIIYINSNGLDNKISGLLRYLAFNQKVFGTIIDSRFINSAKGIYFKREIKNKIYKNSCSDVINLSSIDMLYTEKVLFCR